MRKNKVIGVGILCYDTAEHLHKIIANMVGVVDKIRVFLPDTAFNGTPINENVVSEATYVCARFTDGATDIQIVSVALPSVRKSEREMECDLRNRMSDILESDGCDYSLIIDCDEIYERNKLIDKIDSVIDHDIDVSYVMYRNFYKSEDYEIISYYPCYVPFLTKSKYRFAYRSPEPYSIDLARRYSHNGIEPLFISEPIMCHLSYVRRDISAKIKCWTARGSSTQEDIERVIRFYNNFKGNECAKFTVEMIGSGGVSLRMCRNLKVLGEGIEI